MIGSHNSFTSGICLPLKWWMNLFAPFAKCQNKTIGEQIEHGVNLLDVRIKRYKGQWHISHGIVVYDMKLDSFIFNFMQLMGILHLRILVEGRYDDSDIMELKNILDNVKGINFYECRDKNTWKPVLDFPSLDVDQQVGSMQSWYGKICPWLWTFLHRKKLRKLYADALESERWFLFDFI